MEEKHDKNYNKSSVRLFEIIGYILIITLAIIFSILHLSKWLVIPLLIAVFLIRFMRTRFHKLDNK